MKKDKSYAENKNKTGFFERVNSGLDIDCDMLIRGFGVEWRGKRRVEISGVKRIFIYTESKISFVTPDGIFSAMGKNLRCSSLKCGVAVVEGNISVIGFDIGGENGAF